MAGSGNLSGKFWNAARSLAIGIIFIVLVLPLIGICFADSLLVTRHDPRKADVIVVLGGENKSRVKKTAALYQQGYASKILVTGKNEVELIGKNLVEAGVPTEAILFETAAKSTFENASLSLPILKQLNAKTVLLVTSWFHSRRATSVFKSIAGSIEIYPVPSETVGFGEMVTDKRLRKQVLVEYMKIFGYWFRYGVSPLNNFTFASLY